VSTTGLSQFFRACLGVIAPELSRDLGLTPEDLGRANGAFFLALGVMQLPVGLLFDRYGVRRTISWLTLITVVACAWHGVVRSPGELVAARFLLGLGCAGSFMCVVALCALWYPGPQLSTMLSRVFAFSQVGILLAATPLALVDQWVGWRWAFAGMALLTAITGILFWVLIRDRPPSADGSEARAHADSFAAVFKGLGEVWRTPGLVPILAVHTFAYASMATVLGLWAGPYLADVHGLDGPTRGNVMLVMALAQLVGILGFGPLDRLFDTRKWVVVTGAVATISIFAALSFIPALSLKVAVALLIGMCLITAYSVTIVAHGRSLFPDHLVGRGVTTVNMAQVSGLTVLPLITGVIVGAFPAQGAAAPEIAYRAAFGTIGALLALGLLIYLTAKDAKPSAGR
jgi:MFS family permease